MKTSNASTKDGFEANEHKDTSLLYCAIVPYQRDENGELTKFLHFIFAFVILDKAGEENQHLHDKFNELQCV
jgi:hypothetical protein